MRREGVKRKKKNAFTLSRKNTRYHVRCRQVPAGNLRQGHPAGVRESRRLEVVFRRVARVSCGGDWGGPFSLAARPCWPLASHKSWARHTASAEWGCPARCWEAGVRRRSQFLSAGRAVHGAAACAHAPRAPSPILRRGHGMQCTEAGAGEQRADTRRCRPARAKRNPAASPSPLRPTLFFLPHHPPTAKPPSSTARAPCTSAPTPPATSTMNA